MEDERLFDVGSFAQRLKDLIFPEKLNAYAERAGFSVGVLHKYLSAPEGMNPSAEVVLRICKASRCSTDWLLLGVGDSPKEDDQTAWVPIYDVTLAAGDGKNLDRPRVLGSMPMDMDLLRSLGRASADGLAVYNIRGDSMEPTLSDGGRVVTDTNDILLQEGVFAFRFGNDLRIKRLRPLGPFDVEVISDNPIYAPERISGADKEHFKILGRAIWGGKKL